ncbi:MAG TPA: hypothetical protein VNM40_04100 [Candidatus Paceibacterota bacterium]|nr:hypothetical protein [Candidatus Paceibacterota bacterium]
MNPNGQEFDVQLQQRFKELPKVIRDAILSADVEKHLRDLANIHKLHLDQWQRLENEVMLTLLGFEQPEDLEGNIKSEIGLADDAAHSLALDINKIVFEPIRQKLEQNLEHPAARAESVTGAEAARAQILDEQTEDAPNTPPVAASTSTPVQPATPPPPPPDIKVARPSESTAYRPGEVSSERKNVHDDPYREPPV